MECKYCNQEFSETVLPHHMERCVKIETGTNGSSETPNNSTGQLSEYEQLKKSADELGVKYPGNIGAKKLKELIEDAQRQKETAASENSGPNDSPEKPEQD